MMLDALVLGICLTQLATNFPNDPETRDQNERPTSLEIQSNQIEAPKEARESAPPKIETTRVIFLESPKAGRQYSVSIADLRLSCEAPCVLDVPSHQEHTLTFQIKNRRWNQVRHFSGSQSLLQLELLGKRSARRLNAGGIAITTIGSVWFFVGVTALTLLDDSSDAKTHVTKARTWWLASSIGVFLPLFVILPGGIAMLAIAKTQNTNQKRLHVIEMQPTPEKTSLKATIRDSFQFGVLPTKDGFSAGAGFRF